MGIQGLSKIIADSAPGAVKEGDIKSYFGRKIAIDASMSLYQFLIAVRSEGMQLTDTDGETTSHLMGTFYRTIRLIENGIKPVYVFDGKPPDMKSGQLEKRAERREEAQKSLEKAEEDGDAAEIEKFNRRLVKVTKNHVDECKELLDLMGVPYVTAPSEAEAQCAKMVAGGLVYGTATEDMDALTFGTPILLRHMTFSEARKMPVQEYSFEKVLGHLELTREQFIDFCILLGCDYCDSIKGIGPKRALDLIKQYKTLETIVENLDTKKYIIPDDWPYVRARNLFLNPEYLSCDEIKLKWKEPDEEGLVKYMCGNKQFNEERIRNGAKKLSKARSGTTQGRLDSFFTIIPNASPSNKRKMAEDKRTQNKKAKTSKKGFKGKG